MVHMCAYIHRPSFSCSLNIYNKHIFLFFMPLLGSWRCFGYGLRMFPQGQTALAQADVWMLFQKVEKTVSKPDIALSLTLCNAI